MSDGGAPPFVEPPPLSAVRASSSGRKGCWLAFAVVSACLLGLLLLLGIGGAFWIVTAKDFEATEEQRAAVVTAEALLDWFDIEIVPEAATWKASRFFDGSIEIEYSYQDWDVENISLHCVLNVERRPSDALITYHAVRKALEIGHRFGDDGFVRVGADEAFRWGDDSSLVLHEQDGLRWGFTFIGRKGMRVVSVDCWGVAFDEGESVGELLGPYLERYDKAGFRLR